MDLRTRLAFVGFLILPSTDIAQKYGGPVGLAAYLVLGALGLALACSHREAINGFLAARPAAQVRAAAVVVTVAVVLAFAVLHPIANSGAVGGGSDADEALNLAARELLAGRPPYTPRTYLENPISPMPGAVLLAAPFVWLGTSAYQNLFWLAVFAWALTRWVGDSRRALLLFCVMFAASPTLLRMLAIGSDHLSNAVYVLVGVLWLLRPGPRRSAIGGGWLAAVFLGVALSSRANLLSLAPCVAAALVARFGWGPALARGAVVAAAFSAVTLPVYLWDAEGFSPLHTANKLARLDTAVPHASALILAVTGLVALLAGARQLRTPSDSALLRDGGLILGIPVLAGALVDSYASGKPELGFLLYGSFALFFGAVGTSSALLGPLALDASPPGAAPAGKSSTSPDR